MVKAPNNRISNAIVRHSIDPGRKPRWVEDASARQIARMNEAVAAIRVR
jgi:hypothetical protein